MTTDADGRDGGTPADPLGPDGVLSLREAIAVANQTPGPDEIAFAIPGDGVRTVAVGSSGLGPLPTVSEPVTIGV